MYKQATGTSSAIPRCVVVVSAPDVTLTTEIAAYGAEPRRAHARLLHDARLDAYRRPRRDYVRYCSVDTPRRELADEHTSR